MKIRVFTCTFNANESTFDAGSLRQNPEDGSFTASRLVHFAFIVISNVITGANGLGRLITSVNAVTNWFSA